MTTSKQKYPLNVLTFVPGEIFNLSGTSLSIVDISEGVQLFSGDLVLRPGAAALRIHGLDSRQLRFLWRHRFALGNKPITPRFALLRCVLEVGFRLHRLAPVKHRCSNCAFGNYRTEEAANKSVFP